MILQLSSSQVIGGRFFYFVFFYEYNKGMNNEYNTPNSGCCGRPMHYAKEPKCNYNNCCLNEYRYTMPACIRNKNPDCTAQAVIPSITVDVVDGLTNLANCFVHVTSNNTTYYVDDKHRPMITWSGDVETELPENITTEEQWIAFLKSFNLRSQFLYVKIHNNDENRDYIDAFYFSNTGKLFWAGEFEEIMEA